jgi:hypothetical protein
MKFGRSMNFLFHIIAIFQKFGILLHSCTALPCYLPYIYLGVGELEMAMFVASK